MNRSLCLVLPLLAIVALQSLSPSEAQTIPVGGVILWWGTESELPPGFEVCDGTVPSTPGATLKERKPDLRDRFAKCAKEVSGFRPRSAIAGGSNQMGACVTGSHPLSMDEIPAHRHPIPHQHPLPTHTHTIPSHDHPEGAHVHELGTWVASDVASGSVQILQRARPATDTTGPVSGAATSGPSGVLKTDRSASGSTLAADPAFSGTNQTAGAGHTHDLPACDNEPAFLEMLFVIRVK